MRRLNLKTPLLNASGVFSFVDVFERLEELGAPFGAFVTKSAGPREQLGNENPVVYDTGAVMLNSLALPCQAPEDLAEELKESRLKTPLIVSVFGSSAEEYKEVTGKLETYASAIELNLSCPNFVPGEDSLMRIVGRDPELVSLAVGAARGATDKPLIAKLTPNADYLPVARAAAEAGADYLACANTLGPGLALDIYSRRPILAGLFGGLSGPAIRPITLKMVWEVHKEVKLPIIAYGGIARWEDAIEYALAGASLFGLGTCFSYMRTEQVVELTHEIARGIEGYLAGRALEEIVGGAHA